MGLVKCSGCGRMVSDTISNCIICGENIDRKSNDVKSVSTVSGQQTEKKTDMLSKKNAVEQDSTQIQEKKVVSRKPRQICIGDLGCIIIREDNTAYVYEASEYKYRLDPKEIERWKEDVSHWSNIASIVTCNYSYKSHFAALTHDGRVLATGNNEFGQCNVSGWRNIVQIAVGGGYTLGLDAAGNVKAAGDSKDKRCEVSLWRNIKKICAGQNFSYGIDRAGKVYKAGKDHVDFFHLEHWNNIVNVVEASASHPYGEYTLGLRSDGSLSIAGHYDQSDQNVKVYRSWRNIKKIIACRGDAMILQYDGTVSSYPSGPKWKEIISTWRNIEDIEMDNVHCVGLKKDGTVVIAANPDFSGNSHQKWRGVQKIATHAQHTMGLTEDGTILVADNGLKKQE